MLILLIDKKLITCCILYGLNI